MSNINSFQPFRTKQAPPCYTHNKVDCATCPTTALIEFLGSGIIKGIGPSTAASLVAKYGEDIFTILDQQPMRLSEVSGIGIKKAAKIKESWEKNKGAVTVMRFLQEKGITPGYAARIYKHYGNNTIPIVQENPYRLAEEVWGIGFKLADTAAQHLGFGRESIKRIRAGIAHAIGVEVQQGHLYAELEDLRSKAAALLELDLTAYAAQFKLAFQELHAQGKLKLISHLEKHYVTLALYYFSEKGVAERVKHLMSRPSENSFNIATIYDQIRLPDARGVTLNEQQQKGILTALQNKVTIITGGPGTGKTTMIKRLLDVLDEQKTHYKLAAPTGRAAKRMSESTKRFAMTLHRLLEFDPATRGFACNEHNALKLDYLIVDEASMLDIFLAQAILKALPYNAHLVLIGDIDQLPAVGAGNFLHDLIASAIVPTIHLNYIFRQAQDSLIVVNAHNVNAGKFPMSSLENAKKDFIYIKEMLPEQMNERLTEIFTSTLQRYHIAPENAMVLTPMHKGIVGTGEMNNHLQALFQNNTPPTPSALRSEMYRGANRKAFVRNRFGTTYYIGDRVMQIKNNYDKEVFNGDVGFISDISYADQTLEISFDAKRETVIYDFDEIDELTLAYAISVHKSQGSEYDAVIIPLFMQHFMMLQRNLLYTAITRAKKLCILVGQPKAIALAIKNNKGSQRITFLKEYLITELKCR